MTVLGFCIIFIATTAGAALVFFFKGEMSGKLNTLFLGFASGVMVAASVWSLLIPSIEGAEETYGALSFLPAVIGFLLGGAFLVLIDKLVPHLHKGTNEEEGLKSHLNKPAKLFLAVTIHNIPEGLAVGFAFGAAAALGEQGAFISALGLAVGMGDTEFSGRRGCLPAHENGDGQPRQSLFIRYGQRGGGTYICCHRIFSCGKPHGGAAVVFGVCCWCNDICRRGRSHPRRAPFRTSAFWHMGCNARLCRDDGA